MNKAHSPINWENYPNETTPINEENLNKMDRAIGIIDDRVIEHENKKLSKADASLDIVNVEYDKDTSVFQFTKRNGEAVKVDVSSVVVREGYTKEESDQRYANAIKRTYAGETIVATDSAEAKFESLRVFGRSEQPSTNGYQLFDINADKSISNKTYMYEFTLKPNTPYTLSTNAPVTKVASLYFNGGSSNGNQVNVNIPRTITTDDTGYFFVYVRWGTNEGEDSVNLYDAVLDGTYWIMLNEGDTPLPYEPFTNGPSPNPDYPQPIESVGDDGSVDVGIYGGNLLDIHNDVNNTNAISKIDGEVITVTAKEIKNVARATVPLQNYPLNIPLTLSFDATVLSPLSTFDISSPSMYFRSGNNTIGNTKLKRSSNKEHYSVTITNGLPDKNFRLWLYICSVTTMTEIVSIKFENLKVEVGEVETPYEPCKEPQSLPISTPNGLPGIKVTDASLATYTDSDGIMWVADEIDFAKGKYIKRIGVLNLGEDAFGVGTTSTQNANGKVFSVTGRGGGKPVMWTTRSCQLNSSASKIGLNECVPYVTNTGSQVIYFISSTATTIEEAKAELQAENSKIYYILAEPIETDLTAEQLEAYRALTSNYPTTTILNDENAHMEVTLVADTKNHIEQNYVPVAAYDEIVKRVSALEQRALA